MSQRPLLSSEMTDSSHLSKIKLKSTEKFLLWRFIFLVLIQIPKFKTMSTVYLLISKSDKVKVLSWNHSIYFYSNCFNSTICLEHPVCTVGTDHHGQHEGMQYTLSSTWSRPGEKMNNFQWVGEVSASEPSGWTCRASLDLPWWAVNNMQPLSGQLTTVPNRRSKSVKWLMGQGADGHFCVVLMTKTHPK